MNQTLIPKNESRIEDDLIISYDSDGKPYSFYKDITWVILEYKYEVSFSRVTGEFKDIVKASIYSVINEHSLKSKKSAIKNILEGAVIFEKCIKACGGKNYQFLDDDFNFREVVREAKLRKLKFKTWKNNLLFLTRLYNEGIITKNIGMADKLAKHLSLDAKSTTQTMSIPENIASKYYSEALNTVEKYHEHRTSISFAYEQFTKEYKKGLDNSLSSVTIRKNALLNTHIPINSDFDLDYTGQWLSWLRGACYVVIAAFTGCRDGEIKSFNLSSYEEKHYEGLIVPLLKGIHTKANIGGVPRTVSWVTIPSVQKAIELLWEAFEFSRKQWRAHAESILHIDEKNQFLSEVESLFITLPYNTANKPQASRQAISLSLKNFINSIGYKSNIYDVKEFNLLNPTREGDLKVGNILIPHPHAFRRTFAVYLVRNRLCSLLELKYQFKHMNIMMTSWYSNQAHLASYFDMMMDSELKAEIADENYAYMTDALYYIYNEAETLAGPEGRRIMNLRSESPTTIYLNRDEISKQVKEGRLSIIEHPTGHCTNPRCDRVCDMSVCQYKVITKDKALKLLPKYERLINKFYAMAEAKVNQPNIMSKIFYEVKSLEKVFNEHRIFYKKFEADITATLL